MAATLVDAISAQARRPTILAIDDLHLIDSAPEVMQALQLLVRSLPPGWVVLLSSRRRLLLDLDTVSLGGRLLRLHGRDLRLTPREVAAWARQNWAVMLEPSEARALWRLTEGWPAALALLGQHLQTRRPQIDRRDVINVMAHGRELRAYLEEYVISGLEPLAAQTILTASLLPRVVFPRDEAFLPGETGQAESLLEDFVSRGFLVTATGRRSFTLHPLLRGFAERELWPREAETGLIRRAADHLEQNGENREAAYLYLRAGYFEDAVQPLRTLAVSSLNVVVDFARNEWLDLIPEHVVQDQPWLLVAKAKALQQQSEYSRGGRALRAGRPSPLRRRRQSRAAVGPSGFGLLPVPPGTVGGESCRPCAVSLPCRIRRREGGGARGRGERLRESLPLGRGRRELGEGSGHRAPRDAGYSTAARLPASGPVVLLHGTLPGRQAVGPQGNRLLFRAGVAHAGCGSQR